MDDSWVNFDLHTELMECSDDFLTENYNTINIDGDEFLREILLQTPQGVSEQSDTVDVNGANVEVVENMVSQQQEQEQEQVLNSKKCYSAKTYILSFDTSSIIPATPESCVNLENSNSKNKRSSGEKGEIVKRNENERVKKARSGSQCADHIMAERKRRQELTQRFIALSATIPGLSKTDKASILRAAIDYVKQLQERVQQLEKQDKNVNVGVTPVVVLNNNNEDTDCDGDCNNNILPDIEAKIMGKEVLIEITCEKQNEIELKLFNHIENLQLFVTSSSVLPFGKSAISITIIAQMDEGYEMNVNDLVKSIREVLLKPQIGSESDPY